MLFFLLRSTSRNGLYASWPGAARTGFGQVCEAFTCFYTVTFGLGIQLPFRDRWPRTCMHKNRNETLLREPVFVG